MQGFFVGIFGKTTALLLTLGDNSFRIALLIVQTTLSLGPAASITAFNVVVVQPNIQPVCYSLFLNY